MDETAVLYMPSTVAQTCAALAAFVVTMGLFRLQSLREERRDLTREFRLLARHVGLPRDPDALLVSEIFDFVDKRNKEISDDDRLRHLTSLAKDALRRKDALLAIEPRMRWSRWGLVVFEGWNLCVIAASVVGFNFVPALARAGWRFPVLCLVAVGTAAITLFCAVVWSLSV